MISMEWLGQQLKLCGRLSEGKSIWSTCRMCSAILREWPEEEGKNYFFCVYQYPKPSITIITTIIMPNVDVGSETGFCSASVVTAAAVGASVVGAST